MSSTFLPLPSLPEGWWKRILFIGKVIRFVFSPEFDRALMIVKEVAHTPGMNNGKSWGAIGQYMGKQPGVGENVYRHLLACQKWGPETGDRHVRDTILQLAYHMYKKERS